MATAAMATAAMATVSMVMAAMAMVNPDMAMVMERITIPDIQKSNTYITKETYLHKELQWDR